MSSASITLEEPRVFHDAEFWDRFPFTQWQPPCRLGEIESLDWYDKLFYSMEAGGAAHRAKRLGLLLEMQGLYFWKIALASEACIRHPHRVYAGESEGSISIGERASRDRYGSGDVIRVHIPLEAFAEHVVGNGYDARERKLLLALVEHPFQFQLRRRARGKSGKYCNHPPLRRRKF